MSVKLAQNAPEVETLEATEWSTPETHFVLRDVPFEPSCVVSSFSELAERLKIILVEESGLQQRNVDKCLAFVAAGLRAYPNYVSYSRRRDDYSRPLHMPKSYIGYECMKQCIDALVSARIVFNIVANPWPDGRGIRSRFVIAPRFYEIAEYLDWERHLKPVPVSEFKPVIMLRRRSDKKLISFQPEDAEQVASIVDDIRKINEFRRSHRLHIPTQFIRQSGNDPFGAWVINPAKPGKDALYLKIGTEPHLHMPFLDDLSKGGRPCGDWMQQVPRAIRDKCLLNDEPIATADIISSHISLAYWWLGKERPEGDFYEAVSIVAEVDRTVAKMGCVLIFNCRNQHEAAAELRKFILSAHGVVDREARDAAEVESYRVMRTIERIHQDIAQTFYADFGVTAQNIEARILVKTMLKCVDRGLPFIPLHDAIAGRESEIGEISKMLRMSCNEITREGALDLKLEERTGEAGIIDTNCGMISNPFVLEKCSSFVRPITSVPEIDRVGTCR